MNQEIYLRDESLPSARPLEKWLSATFVRWENSAKSNNNQRGLLKKNKELRRQKEKVDIGREKKAAHGTNSTMIKLPPKVKRFE